MASIFVFLIFFPHFFYASLQTHKVWRSLQGVGYNYVLSRDRCHLLLGLKQGYPLYSPYGSRLGYHQSEAWPVEQKALPPQFYVASVTTRIRTHTLLIKHRSLNSVLLTPQPRHATVLLDKSSEFGSESQSWHLCPWAKTIIASLYPDAQVYKLEPELAA